MLILRSILMTMVYIVTFSPQFVEAQVLTGPISSALGGGGLANIDVLEGPLQNPAVLPHLPNDFHFGLVSGQGSVFANKNDNYWGVLLSDCTKGTYFPAAFAYFSNKNTDGTTEYLEKYYSLAAASFVKKEFSVGVQVSRKEIDQTGISYQQNNLSIGSVFSPNTMLAIGVMAQNFLNPGGDTPPALSLDSTVGTGLYYVYAKNFHFRADVQQYLFENPENKKVLKIGNETHLSYLAVRLGMQWDDYKQRTLITAGLGFLGPRLGFDYSYQHEIQRSGGVRHVIDLRMPF